MTSSTFTECTWRSSWNRIDAWLHAARVRLLYNIISFSGGLRTCKHINWWSSTLSFYVIMWCCTCTYIHVHLNIATYCTLCMYYFMQYVHVYMYCSTKVPYLLCIILHINYVRPWLQYLHVCGVHTLSPQGGVHGYYQVVVSPAAALLQFLLPLVFMMGAPLDQMKWPPLHGAQPPTPVNMCVNMHILYMCVCACVSW